MKFKILGHRGSGASDAPFNQQRDAEMGVNRPDENTIGSFMQAILNNGADGIETDLIQARDGIVLVHANDYSQHLLTDKSKTDMTREKPFIDDLSIDEVQTLEIGKKPSLIPTLADLFSAVKLRCPNAFLNLELKGVQSTDPKLQKPSGGNISLIDDTVFTATASFFPAHKIRYSSFSTSYLKEMYDLGNERSELGMLFDLPQDQGGDVGLPMFCDRPDVYEAFTVAAMEKVLEKIPTLAAVHPEIQSLNNRNVGFAARHGLKIATWGWKEYSPFGEGEGNRRFAKALTNAFDLCKKHDVPELTIITDHALDVRNFLAGHAYKLDQ